MGRASLTIAINGTYNGRAVERAAKSMERLAIQGQVHENPDNRGDKRRRYGGAPGYTKSHFILPECD